jgi:hypothetical protein
MPEDRGWKFGGGGMYGDTPRKDRSKDRPLQHGGLVEVEVADGFAGRGVFGFLHGFFEFLGEDVFFIGFLEPGVAEFVFALAILFGENAGCVGQIDAGPCLGGSFVRQDHTQANIDSELCVAAGAGYFKSAIWFLRHERILPLFFGEERGGVLRVVAVGWAR